VDAKMVIDKKVVGGKGNRIKKQPSKVAFLFWFTLSACGSALFYADGEIPSTKYPKEWEFQNL